MDKTVKKNSPNRAKKAAIVTEVIEKVAKAQGMVFTNYTGLTHRQLETFKREIKKSDATFAVTKNTLLKIALKDAQKGEIAEKNTFEGQTGTLFLYGDIVAPLKALAKLIKDLQKPEIKFGFLDGKMVTKEEVVKISALPSRQELIAKLVGGMKSPIYGLHRSLNWNIQKLVMTLSAVAKTKPQ